jgi:hypothetical protein
MHKTLGLICKTERRRRRRWEKEAGREGEKGRETETGGRKSEREKKKGRKKERRNKNFGGFLLKLMNSYPSTCLRLSENWPKSLFTHLALIFFNYAKLWARNITCLWLFSFYSLSLKYSPHLIFYLVYLLKTFFL